MKYLYKIILPVSFMLALASCSEKGLDAPGTKADPYGDWLEIPAASRQDGIIGTYYDGRNRNYTYNYQLSTYTSLWIAYPLYPATIGGSRHGDWQPAPGFDWKEQINIWEGSYGVDVENTYYARGHQIPDADRSACPGMQVQTYYSINSTPQIHAGFNTGVWSSLEKGVRNALSDNDTIYVVTGASFNKLGEHEKVTEIQPQFDRKSCPVPNYYWKVLLKVKRSGKQIKDADAIGFWLPHQPSKSSFPTFAETVDHIEEWTGFDFFANLPEELQEKVESRKDWNAFSSF